MRAQVHLAVAALAQQAPHEPGEMIMVDVLARPAHAALASIAELFNQHGRHCPELAAHGPRPPAQRARLAAVADLDRHRRDPGPIGLLPGRAASDLVRQEVVHAAAGRRQP
jgi:hypothetical protein